MKEGNRGPILVFALPKSSRVGDIDPNLLKMLLGNYVLRKVSDMRAVEEAVRMDPGHPYKIITPTGSLI